MTTKNRSASEIGTPSAPRAAGWLLAMALLAGSAWAQPSYSNFQLQCRANAGGAGFNLPAEASISSQSVALDADGTVAIRVLKSDGNNGIFVGRNAVGSVVIQSATDYSSTISITNSQLALPWQDGGAEIRLTDGTLSALFQVGGPENVGTFSGAHLLPDGRLSYRSTSSGFPSTYKFILETNVSRVRTQVLIAEGSSASAGPYNFLFTPAGNDSGQMASLVRLLDNSTSLVRFSNTGTPTTLASTGATYNAFSNGVDINASGTVAFFARRVSDNTFELNRTDGTATQRIAQPGDAGLISTNLGNFGPVINAAGLVAFRGRNAAGDTVFVGDGTSVVRIIGDGDTVQTDLGALTLGFDDGFGRQALSGGIAINDAGQVAFAAVFSNGQIGVFVATPTTTPDCVADFDDGSGTGTPDGGVGIEDLLYYLVLFEQGAVEGDVDDGSGTGTQDGGVTIEDLLYFLLRFAEGC